MALNKGEGVTNMSERKLVGTVAVDSGEIAIVDPSLILMMEDFLRVPTGLGNGNFPVYFEKDDAKGGCGKSRIIITSSILKSPSRYGK